MPTFLPTPLLLNSAEEPANGFIAARVTSQFSTGAGVVTRAQSAGVIRNGVVLNAASNGAFFLPVTPEGLAVELVIQLNETRDGRPQKYLLPIRTVSVPDQATITWTDLVDVAPVPTDGVYAVPTWAAALLDVPATVASQLEDVNAAAQAAEDAKVAAQAVGTTNDTVMAGVAADSGSAFAGVLNTQIVTATAGKADAVDVYEKTAADSRFARQGGVFEALTKTFPVLTDTLHPAPPTVTIGLLTASTMVNPVTYRLASGAWTLVGTRKITLDANGTVTSKQTGDTASYEQCQWGAGFQLFNSDSVELHFIVGGSASRIQIEVDGQLCTAAPVTTSGLTASSNYVVNLQFGSVATRKIRILGGRWRVGAIRVPKTAALLPLNEKRLKLAIFGASFVAADASWALRVGRLAGAELFQLGIPGSGFINDAAAGLSYGATARLDGLQEAHPDVILVESSGNDSEGNTQATIQAAQLAWLNAVQARLPGVRIITQGVPPRSAGVTIADYTARNLRAFEAAINATTANVIGYHEYMGTTVPLATYTTAAAYAVGARAVYNGAIFQCLTAIASAPAVLNTRDWKQFGIHTGLGYQGATAGDGTRDVLVGPDNLHPTDAGHLALAALYWPDVQADLIRDTRV
jgi:hypothetical protein